LAAIIEFLMDDEVGGNTFHPSLFTLTGFRAGTPSAIRRLKQLGLIEIAGKNIDGQPLYRRAEKFASDLGSMTLN
jgi:hypothetical protein